MSTKPPSSVTNSTSPLELPLRAQNPREWAYLADDDEVGPFSGTGRSFIHVRPSGGHSLACIYARKEEAGWRAAVECGGRTFGMSGSAKTRVLAADGPWRQFLSAIAEEEKA